MNSFVDAVAKTPVVARTENGMKAQKSSMSSVVDLFYNIGASRGKNITAAFEKAIQADTDIAMRIAQWSRDVRGGAGERQLFRDMLVHLEAYHPDLLTSKFLNNVPNIGRWDDLLIFKTAEVKSRAFDIIKTALHNQNGLCAKWQKRKGVLAAELRNYLGLSPKAYRKLLVGLTNVVETHMCNKEYSVINYSHVPSLAMSRYMTVFHKNDTQRFVEYRNALVRGDEGIKVNASAVYPYDIIKALRHRGDKAVCDKQWDSLPNYMSDANVLPMVDVSGSMSAHVGKNNSISCIDVALSLGLYCADKNSGAFKDMFLTFSEKPEILKVQGTLSQKMVQMNSSEWNMNTNLHAAFDRILHVATKNSVPQADMPKYLLILSDMQFDQCAMYDDSAMKMIERKYESAGYQVPMIVFWNLRSTDNTPVSYDKRGVCLVSGFSPSIMSAVLKADLEEFSPESIMKKAVCISKYDWQ